MVASCLSSSGELWRLMTEALRRTTWAWLNGEDVGGIRLGDGGAPGEAEPELRRSRVKIGICCGLGAGEGLSLPLAELDVPGTLGAAKSSSSLSPAREGKAGSLAISGLAACVLNSPSSVLKVNDGFFPSALPGTDGGHGSPPACPPPEGPAPAPHRLTTLAAAALPAAAAAPPPFIRLARLMAPPPSGLAAPMADQRDLCWSISRSRAALASRSSAVGPVPILWRRGAERAPPMREARLAGEEEDEEEGGGLAWEARWRMLARAEATSGLEGGFVRDGSRCGREAWLREVRWRSACRAGWMLVETCFGAVRGEQVSAMVAGCRAGWDRGSKELGGMSCSEWR